MINISYYMKECYNLINFKMEKNMYDKFIDKDVLTTQDLLSLGFTSNDLTSLVQDGKIRRIKRGYYDLPIADGLLLYHKILFQEKDYERGKLALKRCLEIEPENVSINIRIMFNSLRDGNYEEVFKRLDILSNVDNKFYQSDLNMWLYLLSFSIEVPERYKDKLKNISYSDMTVLPDDLRFKDMDRENSLRSAVAKGNFYLAKKLVNDNKENKINNLITKRLVYSASSQMRKRKSEIFNLLENKEYDALVEMLEEIDGYHALPYSEKGIYLLVKDLISIIDEKTIPAISYSNTNNIQEALKNHCYYKAKELTLIDDVNNGNKKSNLLTHVLDKVISQIENLELEMGVEPVFDDSFVKIMSCFMKKDLDGVYSELDRYLEKVNKCEYKEYVVDLIKLSLLDDNMSFEEPMLTLSELGRDVYEYDPGMCRYEFYLNLNSGNYKKAAIYLDMTSMSERISGVSVDTTRMRNLLVDKIKDAGLEEEIQEMGLESCSSVGNKSDEFCCLADVVENVIAGDNVAMLEPMSDENIKQVLDLVGNINNINAMVIGQDDEKRVVLRYVNRRDEYIPVSDILKRANVAYKVGLYEECIDLYETISSKLDEPRGYIYAKLGLSYYKTAENNDFSRAIDYLTLANVQNENEGNFDYDFTLLIDKLKKRSGYNGIKLKLDSPSDEGKIDGYKNTQKKIKFSS